MFGATLGPYRVDRELGAGGMGKVYAATAPDGTAVAIKVVHPHLVEQPGARERFLREARAGLAISSGNVVRTIECVEAEVDGRPVPVLVLEFVEGRDLSALLAETGRVPEDLCRHLAREIARGLGAIHSAGIVHRDLKPGNVLLTTRGEVKVMDLGLARQASGEDRMSQTGLFLGTAAYAPPEQFFGRKDLDPRSDLYSLGAMLFELCTGRVPFEAEAIGDLVRKVLRDKAPRIGALAPQTTPFFEEVVATLLEKDPDRRFRSAAELGEALDHGEAGDWWAAASMRLQMESRKPLRRVRVQRETELWGREDDLAELRGLWDRAKRGEGAVVLLEGEAGIGKTRLVEELLASIESEDAAQVLVGRHDPAGAGSAAEALAAAFREHLGTEDLDARLRDLLPDTPLLVPAFAALLRGTAAPEGAVALTPDAVQTLFVHLTRALAAEAPLVLVVDDLHFAADEGRALFRAVAMAVETSPVLVVGTARPGLPAKWVESVATRGHATRHEVRRLDGDTVRAALVRHLGGGLAAESVAEQVGARAGGNPYFVVEMLRLLGEQGCLARSADGTWNVTSLPRDLALPESVRDLVEKRLASLAAADRDLLDACACQGHEFDGRLAAETLGRPRMDVLRSLGRLEHATRLVRAAGTRFAFDHHVVHEVVYATTSAARRASLHAAVADAIERQNGAASADPAGLPGRVCADLAGHLLKGGQGARALRYLGPALTHLEDVWANETAAELARQALDAPGLLTGAERAEMCLRRAGRLELLARADEERAGIDEARAIADAVGDVRLRARVAKGLAWHLFRTSKLAEAEATFLTAADLARAAGDLRLEGGVIGGLAGVCHMLGRPGEALAHTERHLALARQAGDRQGEADATGNLANVHNALGRHEEARELAVRHMALAQALGDRRGETGTAGNLAGILAALGRHAEALEQGERHRKLARETGDRRGECTGLVVMGHVLNMAGDVAAAQERFERAVALAREIGLRRAEVRALSNLGFTHLTLGRIGPARAAFQSSLAIARELRLRPLEGDVLTGLARLAEAEGDAGAALRHAEDALSLCRDVRSGDGVIGALLAVADVQRSAGDTEAARAAASEALRVARDLGRPASAVHALALLACLPGGDAAEAAGAFDASGPGADSSAVRLLLWQATGDVAHLRAAKRAVDELVARTPAEHHATMLTNVVTSREIVAAARAAGV